MRRRFTVPRRFHPAYSLLGRWLQHVLNDERRAEAMYLVVISMLALALLLAYYLAWALLKPALLAASTGPATLAFWGALAGIGVLLLLVTVVGFRPAVTVTVTSHALHLEQGTRSRILPFTEIDAVASISALRFHRHYARYAATQIFANRVTPEVLLLDTPCGPVVVGLYPDDHAVLHRLLNAHLVRTAPAFTTQVA